MIVGDRIGCRVAPAQRASSRSRLQCATCRASPGLRARREYWQFGQRSTKTLRPNRVDCRSVSRSPSHRGHVLFSLSSARSSMFAASYLMGIGHAGTEKLGNVCISELEGTKGGSTPYRNGISFSCSNSPDAPRSITRAARPHARHPSPAPVPHERFGVRG